MSSRVVTALLMVVGAALLLAADGHVGWAAGVLVLGAFILLVDGSKSD